MKKYFKRIFKRNDNKELLLFSLNEHTEISLKEIDEELINKKLSLADYDEPDLLIRTGGEKRLSNYLLWQIAYTELYFTDVLWPDFNPNQFNLALEWYAKRQRRFGKTSKQIEKNENA